MTKRKTTDTPRGPGKHAWCYYYKDECKRLKSEGMKITKLFFYMSSTAYQLPSARNVCPVSTWTDMEIKKFIKWQRTFGGMESNEVPMREVGCFIAEGENNGQAENIEPTRQQSSFQLVLAAIHTLEEQVRKNNEDMQMVASKMDFMTERMGKLEVGVVEILTFIRKGHSQSTHDYMSPLGVKGHVVSSPKTDLRQPNPLVGSTKKVAYISSSSNSEEFLQQKLTSLYNDTVRNPKLVPKLVDESSEDVLPDRPLKNKRPIDYQLSPLNKISRGMKPKYRAGPFIVNNPVSVDQLKMIQYSCNKYADHSETLVRTSHEFVTQRGLLSLLPDESIDDEIICMMADYLTRRESDKRSDQPINWFLPTKYAIFRRIILRTLFSSILSSAILFVGEVHH